jgi:hypothetical protein
MPTDLAGIIRRLLNTQSAKHLATDITRYIIKECLCATTGRQTYLDNVTSLFKCSNFLLSNLNTWSNLCRISSQTTVTKSGGAKSGQK